jgi:hypothetical protein
VAQVSHSHLRLDVENKLEQLETSVERLLGVGGAGCGRGGGGGGDRVEGDEDAGRGGGDGGVKEQMMREVLGRLRAHILQVLCIVTLYCNFTRALTFEIFL